MKQTQFHLGKKNGQCLGSSNKGVGCIKDHNILMIHKREKK